MKKHKGVVRMTIGEDLEVDNILEYAKKELLCHFFRVNIVKSTLNYELRDFKLKFEKDNVCILGDRWLWGSCYMTLKFWYPSFDP